MRLFMDMYPLMAALLATAAVIYTLTMGHVGPEPVIWAALTGGILAIPATAAMVRTKA